MVTAFQMVFIIMGSLFLLLSIGIGGFFLLASISDPTILPLIFIPGVFFVVGAIFLIYALVPIAKRNKIKKNGKKYYAKICGYSDNTMVTINGSFTVDLIVRYFNQQGGIIETVLPTTLQRGATRNFPLGHTIDIYELNGNYAWDAKSVREVVIKGEERLMNYEPGKIKMVPVECKHCGASFMSQDNRTGQCPYCGTYIAVPSK